jgi:hypothetical protein
MVGYTSEDDTATQIDISMETPDRELGSYQPFKGVSWRGVITPRGFWADGSEAILTDRLARRGKAAEREGSE